MTSTGPQAAETPEDDEPSVRRVVDVDGVPMSARVREVPDPRAVVLALHGGATTSAYFDAPDRPRLSLLRTGAALGFTVIALDRPGYGASAAHAARLASPARRVDLVHAAVDRLLTSGSAGAGVFLLAHSMGCVLALQVTADARGADLLGVELAGIGLRQQPLAKEIIEARNGNGASPRNAGNRLRDLVWGPSHLYPADVADGAGLMSAVPPFEGQDVGSWEREFARLAAQVRVPVRFTLGDHETVWTGGPEELADIAALFTSSPRVEAGEQAYAGHNLSLGLAATAYHLKVLSFVEECVLASCCAAAAAR